MHVPAQLRDRASVLNEELQAGGKTEEYFHVWLDHPDDPPEGHSRQLASLKSNHT
jgi:hypothetical protein